MPVSAVDFMPPPRPRPYVPKQAPTPKPKPAAPVPPCVWLGDNIYQGLGLELRLAPKELWNFSSSVSFPLVGETCERGSHCTFEKCVAPAQGMTDALQIHSS